MRPKVKEILDRRCYPGLGDIPIAVDLVDVFRKPEACPDVARDAVAIGAAGLWLQEGIVSEEAAAYRPRGRPRGGHGSVHQESPRKDARVVGVSHVDIPTNRHADQRLLLRDRFPPVPGAA